MGRLQVSGHSMRIKSPLVLIVVLATLQRTGWVTVIRLLGVVEHVEEQTPQFATLVIVFHEDHAQGVFVDVHNALGERVLAVCGWKAFDYPHWPCLPIDTTRHEGAWALRTIR